MVVLEDARDDDGDGDLEVPQRVRNHEIPVKYLLGLPLLEHVGPKHENPKIRKQKRVEHKHAKARPGLEQVESGALVTRCVPSVHTDEGAQEQGVVGAHNGLKRASV